MKPIVLLSTFLFSLFINSYAHNYRNLLTNSMTEEQVKNSLILHQKWIPYPDYEDRGKWTKLLGEKSKLIVDAGEKLLDYKFQVIPAMAYIEYGVSGNRQVMEKPYEENILAITQLFCAELAEGKGRFVPQIINGVWNACEMTSWGLSAHLAGVDRRNPLPRPDYEIIELAQSDFCSLLAWVYYYLKPEFDKVDTLIASRLRNELQRRMLDSYMKNSNFWWQAFNATPATMVNNWNPWCNFNVLMCYALLENNPDALTAAVYRTMTSVDKFINYSKQDGACEEGPSYWGHAAGKMYDYLQLLYDITGGKVNLFNDPQVKAMGEYIVNSYVGKGWVINFADASAKGGGEYELIYRYGKAVKSEKMMNYATDSQMKTRQAEQGVKLSRDIFRILQSWWYREEFNHYMAMESVPRDVWYNQTEFCFMNSLDGTMCLATKGGYNNESHNHNDVGTFIFYLHQTPIFIDVGVGTYTRQTFSSERYSIWTMQSNYHNLPLINGVPQSFGSQFKAKECKYDSLKHQFSLDIADAYPESAAVKKYIRTYKIRYAETNKKNSTGIVIQDNFVLHRTLQTNLLNFMTWGEIDITRQGKIIITVQNQKVEMNYNPKQFKVHIETISLSDKRLSGVWGEQIYRISFTALQMNKSGKYEFIINPI